MAVTLGSYYRWSMRSHSSNGWGTVFAPALYLSVNTDTTLPSVNLTYPDSGIFRVGDRINIQGNASDASLISHVQIELYKGGTNSANRVGVILPGNIGDGNRSSHEWPIPSSLNGQTLNGSDYKIKWMAADNSPNHNPNEDYSTGWLTIQPAGSRASGIDVSSHQQAVNWGQVASAGSVQFVFARASLGDGDWSWLNLGTLPNRADTKMPSHANGAHQAGLLTGVYHVGRPTNTADTNVLVADAESEAVYFAQSAGDFIQSGWLRPVLDLEPLNNGTAQEPWFLSKSLTSLWVNAFCNKLQALTGATPMIYAGSWFAATYLDATVAPWGSWIARWNGQDPQSGGPGAVNPWSNWNFWQYTEMGSVPGISGNVDFDVFNGDATGLNAYRIGTLPAPTLTAPLDGSPNQSTAPTFHWSEIPGASSYRLMIATSQAALPRNLDAETAPGLTVNATPTSNLFTAPSNALSPGVTYYWQVKARGPSMYGAWSVQGSFTTAGTTLTDNAGNTRAAARDVGVLTTSRQFSDWVGAADANDFYRFTLGTSSPTWNYSLALSGLSADADVQLLNGSGDVVWNGIVNGAANESGSRILAAGTYFVRVFPATPASATPYSLTLAASANTPADGAGNTPGASRRIGTLGTAQQFMDWVGASDATDYYQFSLGLGADWNYALSLSGLSADANIQLLDSAGAVIWTGNASSVDSEYDSRVLDPATYYVRVYPATSGNNTNYVLRLEATKVNSAPNQDTIFQVIDFGAGVAAQVRDFITGFLGTTWNNVVTWLDDRFEFFENSSAGFKFGMKASADTGIAVSAELASAGWGMSVDYSFAEDAWTIARGFEASFLSASLAGDEYIVIPGALDGRPITAGIELSGGWNLLSASAEIKVGFQEGLSAAIGLGGEVGPNLVVAAETSMSLQEFLSHTGQSTLAMGILDTFGFATSNWWEHTKETLGKWTPLGRPTLAALGKADDPLGLLVGYGGDVHVQLQQANTVESALSVNLGVGASVGLIGVSAGVYGKVYGTTDVSTFTLWDQTYRRADLALLDDVGNTRTTASPLPPWQTLRYTLDTNDRDVFAFASGANESHEFSITNAGIPGVALVVLDAKDNVLRRVTASTTGTTYVSVFLENQGQYYLSVEGAPTSMAGTYAVGWTPGNPDGTFNSGTTGYDTLGGVFLVSRGLDGYACQLEEHSPADLTFTVTIPPDKSILGFAYRATAPGDGDEMQARVNGTVVWSQPVDSPQAELVFAPPIDLSAYAGQVVELRFSLLNAGAANAGFQVDDITLQSAAIGALIGVTDSSGDAADRSVAATATPIGDRSDPEFFSLRNSGDQLLRVTGFAGGGANPGDFVVTIKDDANASVSGASFDIAPGEVYTVQVAFQPTAIGARTATLTFTTNSLDSADATVLLLMQSNAIDIDTVPDLIVSDLRVVDHPTYDIAYQYTIKNVGAAPANLDGPTSANADNVQVQAFVSADTIFNNAGDIPAGGTILGKSPLGMLAPGATFTGTFGASGNFNLATHPYLTLKVDWGEVVEESEEANNSEAVAISDTDEAIIYQETWDASGDLQGWRANTTQTNVAVVDAGGNPNGFLRSFGNVGGTFDIGAVTTELPELTGDFRSRGIVGIALDIRLESGSFDNIWLRFRYADAGHNGWKYPLNNDLSLGAWRTYSVAFDPSWTDPEAVAAGWIQEDFSPSFAATFADVYTTEVRISGEGSLDAGIDNFRAYSAPQPDLAVTALRVIHHPTYDIAYEYTIQNVGTAPANLDGPTAASSDNVSVQAFVSADNVFNNTGDIAAGGAILGVSPLGILQPGETFTGTFGASVTFDPSTHPYLTLKVDWGEVVAESDELNNTAAVLIDLNDTPGFTIAQTGGNTTVSETGTTDTFTLVLTAQPNSNVVLKVTSGDTGEATVSPATLTFTAANWNTAQTVTVTGVDDALVDGNQTTLVSVSVDDANSDHNFDPLPDQTISVTTDDDEITLAIAATDAAKPEGNSGSTPFTFTVTRSGVTTGTTTVNWAVAGSGTNAANGADFVGGALPSGTVTFNAGETAKTITVNVAGDTAVESDEGFTVTLSNASNAQITTATATGTILNDDAAATTLVVTGLTPTASGVQVDFSRLFNPTLLNLYDNAAGALGAADFLLVGATVGPVRGSMVVRSDNRQFTFFKTGGPLEPDTYAVTLRSAANGFTDASGNLLDGDANGVAGDNFAGNLVVSARPVGEVIVSLPDFARGFGQAVKLPNENSNGFPVTLSTGQNVTGVDLDLVFDPLLLNVTEFVGSVAGAASAYNLVSPGRMRITVSSAAEFSSTPGTVELGRFVARVPDNAPYAAKQILRLENVNVEDSQPAPRASRADDGLHIVAMVGDTNASRTYSSGDVTLLQRASVGQGSGFITYPLVDPMLIADVNRSTTLTSGDATLLQRLIVGTSILQAPLPPDGIPLPAPGGPDPRLFIPTDLTGQPGQTVTVPVMLQVTEAAGISLSGMDLAIGYDPAHFTVSNFQVGSLLSGYGFSAPEVNAQPAGFLRATFSTGNGPNLVFGQSGVVFQFDVTVSSTAPNGGSRINLLRNYLSTYTTVTDNNVDELVLVPVPTNADSDPVDGVFTIGASVPGLSIAAADATKAEGHSGSTPYTFTVTRSGTTTGTSTAQWAVTGSGGNPANGADFAGGTLPSGTVTFNASETSKTITVNVAGETTVEPDEGFTVTLSNASNAQINTATATGTILNDDDLTGFKVGVELVLVASPSPVGSNSLPTEISQVPLHSKYYVELWVQDLSAGAVGVQGGSVDLHYSDTALVDATGIMHQDFAALPTGQIQDALGLVDDLGGATFDPLRGVAPQWARLAYVEVTATGMGSVEYSLAPGQFRFALSGLGNFDWSQVDLSDTAQVEHAGGATVDVRLVRTPTATDPNGEASALPNSDAWFDEWEPYWAEIWLSTPNTNALDITAADASLSYSTAIASAKRIDFHPSFTAQGTPVIDDVAGRITGIHATTALPDLGDDRPVLLARVLFEPTAADQAAVDVAGRRIGPAGLTVSPLASQVSLSGGVGAVAAELGSAAAAEVWAVPYDVDDSDLIDFGDFSQFAPRFGQSVTAADPYTWWADFDKSGAIDFGDFSYFAPNFGKSKPSAELQYPPNYPEAWRAAGGGGTANGAGGEAETPLLAAGAGTTVDLELVALLQPSSTDALASLPGSITRVASGAEYYVEVWVQQTLGSEGISGGSVDIRFNPSSAATFVNLGHGGVYTVLAGGSYVAPDLVDNLRGATFSGGAGVAPQWARLGYVQLAAAGDGEVTFNLEAGSLQFSLFGLGNVPWIAVDLDAVTLNMSVTPWRNTPPCDVNDDGRVTPLDALILINDINARSARDLGMPPVPPDAPPPYLDPTGDNRIEAADVLFVLNFINANLAAAEAEAMLPNAAPSTAVQWKCLADDLYAEGFEWTDADARPRSERGIYRDHASRSVAQAGRSDWYQPRNINETEKGEGAHFTKIGQQEDGTDDLDLLALDHLFELLGNRS